MTTSFILFLLPWPSLCLFVLLFHGTELSYPDVYVILVWVQKSISLVLRLPACPLASLGTRGYPPRCARANVVYCGICHSFNFSARICISAEYFWKYTCNYMYFLLSWIALVSSPAWSRYMKASLASFESAVLKSPLWVDISSRGRMSFRGRYFLV